jgi:ribosomal protein L44E
MKYQIWYMKPSFIRGIVGSSPDSDHLSASHVHLKISKQVIRKMFCPACEPRTGRRIDQLHAEGFAPSSPAWRRRRYAPQSGGSDRWRRPVPAAARQFGCRAGGAGREIIPGHRASRSHRLVGLAEKPPLLLCPKYCILGTAKTRKLQRLLYFGSAENDRKSREPYISPDSATTMPA